MSEGGDIPVHIILGRSAYCRSLELQCRSEYLGRVFFGRNVNITSSYIGKTVSGGKLGERRRQQYQGNVDIINK